MSISPTIRDHITTALAQIAAEHHVRILYACESGSRAWGMESAGSDYDVRFLYVRPRNAYLRLDTPRDVIECPLSDDLDISGWDVFKALRLFRKSNPPLLEWLNSPVVYREEPRFVAPLSVLAHEAYSPVAVFYHYLHMAHGNYRQYIENKSEVLLKKYLYVIRPLIALTYLEQWEALPPVNFPYTLEQIELLSPVREHILALLERKRTGDELGRGACDFVLNGWIDGCFARWQKPFEVQHVEAPNLLTAALEELLMRELEDEA